MMYNPHVGYDAKCIWVCFMPNCILCGVFALSLILFGTAVTPRSLSLSPLSLDLLVLVEGFTKENANSETCLF